MEAGRYTPTGGNRQPIRYILVKEKLKEVKELAIQGLYNLALDTDDNDPVRSIYKNTFKKMYKRYKENGNDSLFYDAPLLMIVVGDMSLGGSAYVDGGLAASNMELMAYSQGLGICYNGFCYGIKCRAKDKRTVRNERERSSYHFIYIGLSRCEI